MIIVTGNNGIKVTDKNGLFWRETDMSRVEIEKGIVIDEAEGMLQGLNAHSRIKISDLEVIFRFIREEKNTRFYFDDKLACKMQDEKGCIYLWLDTGLKNEYGSTLFISLLKQNGQYEGHYFGTADILAKVVKSYFNKNIGAISKNLGAFKNKYLIKSEQRVHQYITEEKDYLIKACNGTEQTNIMAELISTLSIEFPEIEEEVTDIEEIAIVKEEEFNDEQNDITVSLLLEELDARQKYEEELLAKIEELSLRYKAQDESIENLKNKNKELNDSMVRVRTYIATENEERQQRLEMVKDSDKVGHALLGDKKILVLGDTALGENIMKGIAKTYGFENKDFDFETDYSKVVNYSGRIQNSSRYYAVIFGACPHKVAGLGDYSSLIEKFKQCEDQPYAADARCKSGKLKVTKESFRMALNSVCNSLREACAC